MATVIKQIKVYNGSAWLTANIGVDANNVTLSSNLAGSTSLQTALNNILPASQLSANKVLISLSNKKITSSSVTSTLLGYLSGTTANIQTALNTITNAISSLNDKFSQLRTSLSIYNNRCTALSGGYIIIGNLVVVTLQFSAVGDFSGLQAYLTGLPVPRTDRGVLSVSGQALTTPHIQAYVTDGGNLTLGGNIANNETISIAGAYIALNT